MRNALNKIIGKFKNQHTPNPPENINFVTDPARIIGLIKTIKESYQLCTVTVKGSKKIFSTSLIDFQPEQNFLILDEISPAEGNTVLQVVRTLKLSATVNGVHLAFKLSILDHGLKKGILYYKAGLPDKIYYPQRRKAPRVFTLGTEKIHFQALPIQNNALINGEVLDLSRGGICITLSETPVKFERGDVLENCKIILPDEYCISFSLAIRSTMTLTNQKIQIGGYFLSMQPKQRRKLEHFIALLERKSIRKRKN